MSELRAVSIAPLSESNFVTWKIQIKMMLLRKELWDIVQGEETAPDQTNVGHKKFCSRSNRALSLIVMAVEPRMLYLIGEPENPKIVFDKLCNVFQKKTWANKLRLRKKLYSLRLVGGAGVHQHLKNFTEVFNELAVLGDPLQDEDRVIHLLSSLPESYNNIVTAFEAQPDIPSWEIVSEKITA